MTEKITKIDRYNELATIVANCDHPDKEALADFLAHEIEMTTRHNSRKRPAKEDAIIEVVRDVLTSEPQTIAEVTATIGDDSITSAKVQYRLNRLVKEGAAEAITLKTEDGRSLRGYKLA